MLLNTVINNLHFGNIIHDFKASKNVIRKTYLVCHTYLQVNLHLSNSPYAGTTAFLSRLVFLTSFFFSVSI